MRRFSVKVLAAERTFWEKVTVLHACCHCPEGRAWKERQSRHFYDVARLYEAGVGKRALADLELLRKVAEHQAVFFRSSWSKYEEAVPGSLRLVPPARKVTGIPRRRPNARTLAMSSTSFAITTACGKRR